MFKAAVLCSVFTVVASGALANEVSPNPSDDHRPFPLPAAESSAASSRAAEHMPTAHSGVRRSEPEKGNIRNHPTAEMLIPNEIRRQNRGANPNSQ